MNEQRYLPDSDRVGILTSTVLLAFALTRLIQVPEFNLEVQLPGFFLLIPLNLATAMGVLTAGLTATGMDWLLHSHPSLNARATYQWWLLPEDTLPGQKIYLAWGYGGQFIFVIPALDMIVVSTAANYTGDDDLKTISFLRTHILKAVVR